LTQKFRPRPKGRFCLRIFYLHIFYSHSIVLYILQCANGFGKEDVDTSWRQSSILQQRIIEQDNYSRRENIIFTGVNENRHENCFDTVHEILSYIDGNDVSLQRCHRLGLPRPGYNRDIIARLSHFPDKMLILQRRGGLPKGVYVNEDFAPETKRHIDTLRPILREAKKFDPNAKMIKDKIFYENKPYTVNNIRAINLDIEKISEKKNADVIAFAGRYSRQSNLFPQPIDVDDRTYPSTEHYYQYQKCLSAGDVDAAAQVLLAQQPEDAMAAGKAVKKQREWTNKEGKEIMKKAVKIKFSSESMKVMLRSTGKRKIVEATRNPHWGIGEPFTSLNVLNPRYQKGDNLMGMILMEIRDEFEEAKTPM